MNNLNKNKILIVEDEGIIAMNTKLSLLRLGYDVLPIALSGKTAIDITAKNSPDLILMDIRIRGELDGIDTAIRIKEKYNIPILYVSAHADEKTMARVEASAVQGFLHKPVTDMELSVAIEEALANHRS